MRRIASGASPTPESLLGIKTRSSSRQALSLSGFEFWGAGLDLVFIGRSQKQTGLKPVLLVHFPDGSHLVHVYVARIRAALAAHILQHYQQNVNIVTEKPPRIE